VLLPHLAPCEACERPFADSRADVILQFLLQLRRDLGLVLAVLCSSPRSFVRSKSIVSRVKPLIAGGNADPEGDGIANWLE